jgi:peptide/nickel transport system substrate-binding protein
VRTGRVSAHLVVPWLIAVVAAAGCGPSAPAARTGGDTGSSKPATPKHVTAAIYGNPTSVINRMNTAQVSIPGASAVEQLGNAGLSDIDGGGQIHPQLAETVPSVENGLWRVFPDGRMETTWKIKPNALWHDGTPVTADDVVFTTMVDQDPELPILRNPGYASVEAVEAPDPKTVVVKWKRPYIDADSMFTSASGSVAFALPLPRHKLEDAYNRDKANFQALPFWGPEFVGTGPYSVKEFAPGSHVLFQANDDYVFGRPKIDEIEIRFILDLNVIVTNLLSGAIDMTLGRGFSIEQVLTVREQWQDGTVEVAPRSWIVIHPQFMNPSPSVIADVQFRRALMHATDRQSLMDSLQGGLTGVAHVFLSPTEPEYRDVESVVQRYEYDPRRAAQLIEGLGYAKGPDGTYRDAANQRLAVEMRTYGVKVSDNATVSISNAWTQFGVATEPQIVPPQRITDREYMATFPSFLMYRQPNAASDLGRVHGSLAPTADNRFVGSNYARYVSPEFDGLIDRYLTTIPKPERLQALREAVRHISENLNLMGLFYDAEISFLSNRLQNATVRETRLWNIQLWDTKS